MRIDDVVRMMVYGKMNCPVYRLLEIRNRNPLGIKEYCPVYGTLDEQTRVLYCCNCKYIPPYYRGGLCEE